MKRILKIVIPLVLIVLILSAAVWLFIFHRPDLTNDFLISQARTMADRGRYSRAIRYYTWATALEPQRDDTYIELSETYAKSGNYTKAEYTLVKAISNQPDMTELYAALCRTYVEQGKLLDAAQMMERTSDPVVKAELDAMRPSAPVIEPEGGYYTEYIDVTVSADTDNIFVTTTGEYPSSDQDLYAAPITLSGGETTVLAIAVNEDGLVSQVVRNGYTIGGVVEAVTFADPAIDQTIREQLSLSSDAEIMTDLLWSITNLSLPDTTRNLSDLSYFTGLRSLVINGISGLDFTVLSQIPSLQELDLSGCTISSNALQSIGSLTELKKLRLDSCALTDISAFSQLVKLEELCLSNNSLEDIGALSLMPLLQSVELSNNPLTSIAALSACDKLKYLDISSCSVSSLGSLSEKKQLETLLASNNQIRILDELSSCSKLSVLEVNSNFIKDIAVLTELPSLVRFEANHNEISTLPAFDKDTCLLVYFGVNYNQIEDVTGLSGINTLNYLNIDYNKVSDLLPIAENSTLIKVNAWDNPITPESVEALSQYEIILNYNPNFNEPES